MEIWNSHLKFLKAVAKNGEQTLIISTVLDDLIKQVIISYTDKDLMYSYEQVMDIDTNIPKYKNTINGIIGMITILHKLIYIKESNIHPMKELSFDTLGTLLEKEKNYKALISSTTK